MKNSKRPVKNNSFQKRDKLSANATWYSREIWENLLPAYANLGFAIAATARCHLTAAATGTSGSWS